MGTANRIKYDLSGTNYVHQNLISNSEFAVCSQSDNSIVINEASKVQDPGLVTGTGWVAESTWVVGGGNISCTNATANSKIEQVVTGLTPYALYTFGITETVGAGIIASEIFNGRTIQSGYSTGGGTLSVEGTANSKGELTIRVRAINTPTVTLNNLVFERREPQFISTNPLTGFGPNNWKRLGTNLNVLTRNSDLAFLRPDSAHSLRVDVGSLVANDDGLYYDISDPHFKRVLTFGCWIYQNNADSALVGFSDETLTTHSFVQSTVTGGWVWLETTFDNSGGTMSKIGIRNNVINTTFYVAQTMLVYGNSIGEGNYSKPNKEWVYLEEPGLANALRWDHPSLWGDWGRQDKDLSLCGITFGAIPGNICEVEVFAAFQNVAGNDVSMSVGESWNTSAIVNRGFLLRGYTVSKSYVGVSNVSVKGGAISVNSSDAAGSINSVTITFKKVCLI